MQTQALGQLVAGLRELVVAAGNETISDPASWQIAGRTADRGGLWDMVAGATRFGSDLSLLAREVASGTLEPRVGLETSWHDPLGALNAMRERQLEGKAVLVVD